MRIFALIPLTKTRLAAFVGGSLGQQATAETVTIPKPADKICEAKYFCLMNYIAAKTGLWIGWKFKNKVLLCWING